MKPPARKELSFEESLEKLEELIARMESGDIPLDELVRQFEVGNELLTSCARRLHHAGRKIELLKKNRLEIEFGDFDPDSS